MAKKISVLMKNSTFYRKDPMSIIAFLQYFKSACDACKSFGGTTTWIFKQYLTDPDNAIVNPKFALPNFSSFYTKGTQKSHSTIFQFFSGSCVTEDNMAKLDLDVQNLRQRSMTPAEFAQDLWTRTQSCVPI